MVAVLLAVFIFFLLFAFPGKAVLGPDIFIFGLQIHLYSLFMAVGLLLAYSVSRRTALAGDFSGSKFDAITLAGLIGGVVGARLFFVLGHWPDYYRAHGNEIFNLTNGGLSFYGALIGGLVAIVLVRSFFKFSLFRVLDYFSLGLPVGQAIGRLGNYFNQEAFGSPTNLPWKMFVTPNSRPAGYENSSFFHPTFLYEAIGLLLIFWLLQKMKFRVKTTGLLFAVYAIFSASLRIFIEDMRLDALDFAGLKISLVAATLLLISGLLVLLRRNRYRGEIE